MDRHHYYDDEKYLDKNKSALEGIIWGIAYAVFEYLRPNYLENNNQGHKIFGACFFARSCLYFYNL